ncbi:enoyl-CoA hydratase/isomerase family protein [Planomonospora sp. ID91781]|uniref:Enoyl-CoA hydratase n=3 Tax=Planomonospora TaxID=1998 RepID=A0A171DHY2_9ACTN|nr:MULTISPECIES: enoyl-CoA hydratase/isomerase family protein [Planomonospora]MBG0823847.1 enoyl-CoA hydratase/isomerase family protein [Planomonospora sp. ID91781]GAT68587.1 enoyl-CoA hydratase [Planomonospora sphaerica]GGK66352.1 enoyl-CoA hydratase [Planomonospora parontospora]GII08473.1 enoyl-CoA hydratase [Planomonospora parontospora subsp. parontospora]
MAEVVHGGSAEEISLAEVGLRFEVDGEIATITLARPEKRNAQTFATWSALARIGDDLPQQVRVVVVRGEGPSFSAGIDLRMFTPEGVPGQGSFASTATLRGEAFDERIAQAQQGFMWLRRPDIVSIAAVQGHAVGAGFQLALACDLRILADDAKLCMKEPALGLVPDLTGTKPLVDLVGLSRAVEICLTARTVGAEEAARIGLAELVVAPGDLTQAVRDLAAALLATNRDAATATKRLLQGASGRTLEEQCAAERQEQMARIKALFG